MLAIYRAFFTASINTQLQYRIGVAIWMIGLVLQPVVSLVVWQTVAGSGTVHGFTRGDFAAYFLILMIVDHVTFTWIMFEYEFLIRSGQFAVKLLKPVHPIHNHVADNVTYKLITLVIVVPAYVVLTVLFQPTFTAGARPFLLFLPALLLAAVLRFVLEYTLALAAFYTTRVSALNQLYNGVLWLLAGQVAPLALLPGPVRAVAEVLPFRAMVSFPVELALGRLDAAATVQGFLLQIVWLVATFVLFRVVWSRGVRVFSAVGT